MRVSESQNSHFPACQILLITDILVGGDEPVKACRLGLVEESSVDKPLPPPLDSLDDQMTGQGVSQRRWCAVVKEYAH